MWHGIEVLINKIITCDYAGKSRVGKVVKADRRNITIKFFKGCNQKPQYRTLTIDGITNITIVN